jgi:cyanophycin synthetase
MYAVTQLHQAVKKLVFPPLSFAVGFHFHSPDLRSIATWLTGVYPESALLLASVKAAAEQHNEMDHAELTQFACSVSVMSLLFFKQLNFPLFEPPEVLSAKIDTTSSQRADIGFSIANIGATPAKILQEVFSAALQTCTWLGQQSVNSASLKQDGIDCFQNIAATLTSKNGNYSSTIKLLERTHKAGIFYCHLGGGVYRFGWGKNATLFFASMFQADSYCGTRLIADKRYTSKLLRIAGIASPEHLIAKNVAAAIKAAQKIGFPVVLKPIDAAGGEGVTVDLKDELSIQLAFDKAIKFSKTKTVLVERQVSGVCHRLFMVNGRLLYAVKRWPPSVFGDGVSTLRQLVEAHVQHELTKLPFERVPVVRWDNETERYIRQIGFDADYIPVPLQRIPLRRIESTQWGGFDEEVTSRVHPDTLRQARIACQLVHMSVVGVDVITDDISLPLAETGGVINELNAGPTLGGAAISRSYIPEYIKRLVPEQGHIGLEVFTNAELDHAMLSFRQKLEQGIQCYFVSDSLVIDHQGNEMPNSQLTVAEQLRELIFNPDVEALCIVSDLLAEQAQQQHTKTLSVLKENSSCLTEQCSLS